MQGRDNTVKGVGSYDEVKGEVVSMLRQKFASLIRTPIEHYWMSMSASKPRILLVFSALVGLSSSIGVHAQVKWNAGPKYSLECIQFLISSVLNSPQATSVQVAQFWGGLTPDCVSLHASLLQLSGAARG